MEWPRKPRLWANRGDEIIDKLEDKIRELTAEVEAERAHRVEELETALTMTDAVRPLQMRPLQIALDLATLRADRAEAEARTLAADNERLCRELLETKLRLTEYVTTNDRLSRELLEAKNARRTAAETKALDALHLWLHQGTENDCDLIEACQDFHEERAAECAELAGKPGVAWAECIPVDIPKNVFPLKKGQP